MSDFTPHQSGLEKAAIFCLALPVLAVKSALRISKPQSTSTPSATTTASALPTISAYPSITTNAKFLIADRVYCSIMGNLKVCFYQYVGIQVIRAVARKGNVTKEVHFTPAIAKSRDLSYDMDGAIAWVRTVGFKSAIAASMPLIEDKSSAPDAGTVIEMEPTKTSEPSPVRQIASQPKRNRPFTGKVISMGETVRPGRDGGAPFTTYTVKLQSEYGSLEKEFNGEHLAELVESKGVVVGQLVRVQLLGRAMFVVMNNGKLEERTRNEYSLDII